MGWLIAVVAISLVLAPLMWIMPTPTQKRRARMREVARHHGLQVRIGAQPQTRRQQVRKEEAAMGVSYIRHFPRSRKRHPTWLLWCDAPESEFRWPEPLSARQRRVLQDVLEELPEEVVALECTGDGLAVHWRERGDEDTVRQLAQLLDRMAQSLEATDDDE